MRIPRGALVALAASAVLASVGVASAQSPCGGLLQPKCPPPPPPPPPAGPIAATLTLEPETITRRVDTKQNVTFRGAIGGVPSPGGITIVLHQTVPGYAGALADKATQVKTDGTFAFEIDPAIGLEVQAEVRAGEPATGRSPVRRLVMRSVQTLHLRAITRRRGRFALTTSGPSGFDVPGSGPPQAGPARIGHLYLVAKTGRTARRIGSGRVRGSGCPSLCKRAAIGYFRITRTIARDRRSFIACARGPMFIAIEDAAVSPACGNKFIKLRQPA
jgi:hypothetical protein